MDVSILNLQTLFNTPVRYEIPSFQRPYIWNQERQWEPLWDDVRNTAERNLDSASSESAQNQSFKHFLGAVVLQQQRNVTALIAVRRVVDGQQRLTTLQLLLDAAQEVFEQQASASAKRLSNLVLNPEEYRGDDPDRAFKVWPTRNDQKAFRHAMRNDLSSAEQGEKRIVQAHEFFKREINRWLDELPQEKEDRTEALEHTITSLLEMVVIDLDPKDDPHIIFETLNARGTPLLQSDLIKNMVLYEAEKVNVLRNSEDESRLWSFGEDWWRQEIRQGRIVRPRIDAFLNYWLIMRTHQEITADHVFPAFRNYADNVSRIYDSEAAIVKGDSKPIERIAGDMGRAGIAYRELDEATPKPGMETFLYRWGTMQAGVLTPVLLWLLSSEVPELQLMKGLHAIESYLIRRMVCRMTTRDYNHLFINLVGKLETAGVANAGDSIVEYLRGQTAYSRQWPSDQQFEDTFVRQPLYWLLTRGRLRIVLEGIEGELRTVEAESRTVPRNLTIEHILPQRWHDHWTLPTDVEDKTAATIDRDHLLHSIGNLTLVNNRLNPALSNAGWRKKRAAIRKHSVLFLNKTLLDEAPEVWDETAIEERAKRLFKVSAKVWPHADRI